MSTYRVTLDWEVEEGYGPLTYTVTADRYSRPSDQFGTYRFFSGEDVVGEFDRGSVMLIERVPEKQPPAPAPEPKEHTRLGPFFDRGFFQRRSYYACTCGWTGKPESGDWWAETNFRHHCLRMAV